MGDLTQASPNEPMVPTAPTAPAGSPPRPRRRHVGQPLDSSPRAADGLRRPTRERVRRSATRQPLGGTPLRFGTRLPTPAHRP
jgi:hypothetical protein